MTRSDKWYALFPNDVYALSFRLDRVMNEYQFRAYVKEWEGIPKYKRMIGVKVWAVSKFT